MASPWTSKFLPARASAYRGAPPRKKPRTSAPKSTNTCMPWKERAAKLCCFLSPPTPESLKREAENLDAFVLTGSPADVDPAHYGAKRHPAAADADAARERTDFTLLEHALAAGKPVLAICYGIQSLNVFLGGSLVQDIPTELGTKICHSPEEDELPGRKRNAGRHARGKFRPGRVFHPLRRGLRRRSTRGITSRCWSRGAACASRRARRTAWLRQSSGRTIRTGSWACSGIRKECRGMRWRRRCFANWSAAARLARTRSRNSQRRAFRAGSACDLCRFEPKARRDAGATKTWQPLGL